MPGRVVVPLSKLVPPFHAIVDEHKNCFSPFHKHGAALWWCFLSKFEVRCSSSSTLKFRCKLVVHVVITRAAVLDSLQGVVLNIVNRLAVPKLQNWGRRLITPNHHSKYFLEKACRHLTTL